MGWKICDLGELYFAAIVFSLHPSHEVQFTVDGENGTVWVSVLLVGSVVV